MAASLTLRVRDSPMLVLCIQLDLVLVGAGLDGADDVYGKVERAGAVGDSPLLFGSAKHGLQLLKLLACDLLSYLEETCRKDVAGRTHHTVQTMSSKQVIGFDTDHVLWAAPTVHGVKPRYEAAHGSTENRGRNRRSKGAEGWDALNMNGCKYRPQNQNSS